MSDITDRLEEQIAHLTRSVEDLSEVVARQEEEIVTLNRRVHMLMQREGERDASSGGAVVLGNERPPHY
ncbi:SlyX family protein [Sulfitobacter sp. PS-8MA]|uniref:SlyX family protein n=1 Tax=Sulfitobacter sp. PS-8MA TaxID=3237707 RepID=UPI0034C603AA